mmetsp:Transcript_77480/g.194838  ORF Transcript_77480/g.194838 Transcript_77480/m.194838 type:complete len:216 (+) Transcript_77480:872-1519(+)
MMTSNLRIWRICNLRLLTSLPKLSMHLLVHRLRPGLLTIWVMVFMIFLASRMLLTLPTVVLLEMLKSMRMMQKVKTYWRQLLQSIRSERGLLQHHPKGPSPFHPSCWWVRPSGRQRDWWLHQSFALLMRHHPQVVGLNGQSCNPPQRPGCEDREKILSVSWTTSMSSRRRARKSLLSMMVKIQRAKINNPKFWRGNFLKMNHSWRRMSHVPTGIH